jgi:hypothetical protein
MDASIAYNEFETALVRQLHISGDDPAMAEAASLLLEALQPAISILALRLAEQAAAEASAQLPDHEVDVVVSGGEPGLHVRPVEPDLKLTEGAAEARITVRLPAELKQLIEDAAGASGDSVNTFVINTLASRAHRRERGGQVKGIIDL